MPGGTSEARIPAQRGCECLPHQVVTHRARRVEVDGIAPVAQCVEFQIREDAHAILRRRDRIVALGHKRPVTLQKGLGNKTGVAMVGRTLLVEEHLALQRGGPRDPWQQMTSGVEVGHMAGNHSPLIGLRMGCRGKCENCGQQRQALPSQSRTGSSTLSHLYRTARLQITRRACLALPVAFNGVRQNFGSWWLKRLGASATALALRPAIGRLRWVRRGLIDKE